MNEQALKHAVDFIKSWLQMRYEQGDVPGFVVAIAHRGQMLMNDAYGYADLERKLPMTPHHRFRIASHSKTFTATAVMILAEEGRVRLDDYVVDYLPWLREHHDARWTKVTIRQLLSHGAGVIRDGLEQDYWQLTRPFPDEETLTAEILETGLILDNNTKLKYSNYGYSVLGLVIEAASGQSYHQFVTERIITPLGLQSTAAEYQPALDDVLAMGYTRADHKTRRPIPHSTTGAMAAATGFCSTTEDLCTYFAAHMVGSGQLLSDESKKEMQRTHFRDAGSEQPSTVGYGLGFVTGQTGKRSLFGHSGGYPGFITDTLADPKDGLVVTALTNGIDGPAGRIAEGIYKIIDYFQENTPKTQPTHHLAHLEGTFMNLWNAIRIVVAGDKVTALMAPETWEPFGYTEALEYRDDRTFTVSSASGFSGEGEQVQFQVGADGAVKTLQYTGATLWPRDVWLEKHRQAIKSR